MPRYLPPSLQTLARPPHGRGCRHACRANCRVHEGPYCRCTARGGLTLIEMVVVLLIMTILATVAVEMVTPQVDQTRFETTQQTIERVQDAIFAERITGDGRLHWSGFYVDLGRLPQAYLETDSSLSLRELWQQTVDLSGDPTVVPYTRRDAETANVTNEEDGGKKVDSDGDDIYYDSEVQLASGWRGPYLKLPIGADSLTDGWGHQLTGTLGVPATSHLRTWQDIDGNGQIDADELDIGVSSEGQAIYGLRSFGADNNLDAGGAYSPYENDLPSSSLPISLRPASTNLPSPPDTTTTLQRGQGTVTIDIFIGSVHAAAPADIIVQIYYPDGETGLIKVEQAYNSNEIISVTPSSGVGYDEFEVTFQDSDGDPVHFPVGNQVVRAYLNNPADTTDDFGDGTDDPTASSPTPVLIAPTGNRFTLFIP